MSIQPASVMHKGHSAVISTTYTMMTFSIMQFMTFYAGYDLINGGFVRVEEG